MEPFIVHILGCGSARPTRHHKPACQVVNLRNKLFMIDCGESAQMGMNLQGLNLNRLGHIFISHNHGDHVFGLPGLISTMALLGRTADLHIFAPKQVEDLIKLTQRIYCENINFQILFHAINTRCHEIIFQDRSLEVWSIPLTHRIPCCGFLLKEARGLPHIRRNMIDAFDIPLSQINNIKAGAGWTTPDGTTLTHEMLTSPAAPARKYAYCSDTLHIPQLSSIIQGVDLLFHEATYTDDMQARAKQTYHTTGRQAATLASEAQVNQLCIGHYSARIHNERLLLDEAKKIFPKTILAYEGLQIKL